MKSTYKNWEEWWFLVWGFSENDSEESVDMKETGYSPFPVLMLPWSFPFDNDGEGWRLKSEER